MTEKTKVQVKVDQISATACRGTARHHSVVMDRPEAKGGEDQGPMGGETLLMSLGGCVMSNLLAAGIARNSALSDVRLEITGELAGTPSRFETIEMTVFSSLTDRPLLEKLVIIAERGCIVANTLKQGLRVTIKVG